MKNKTKQDKGQAGLSILLSVIVMLFIIGLIVMIFSLMGVGMENSSYTSTTGTVANESVTELNDTVADELTVIDYRDVVCSSVVVINASDGALATVTTDYTMDNCEISGVALSDFLTYDVNVSYSYVYEADNTATNTMNDTRNSIATVTDWFDIFIVISAMVVLILLTVIIITAIRSSGMVAGGQSGGNSVGTA